MSIEKEVNCTFNNEAYPNREQHLLVSLAKHWRLLKDGSLKYQKSPISPATTDPDQLVYLLAAYDVDTGAFYSEPHDSETKDDLLGFLTRAWHKKIDHPMHGVPQRLNIPRKLEKENAVQHDIEQLIAGLGVVIGSPPSGFQGGIHTIRLMSNKLLDLLYFASSGNKRITLFDAQRSSALLTSTSGFISQHHWFEPRMPIVDLGAEWLSYMDSIYEPEGSWRLSPFDVCLNGIAGLARSPTPDHRADE